MKKFISVILILIMLFVPVMATATTLLDIRTDVRKYLFDSNPGVDSYKAFLNAQIDEAVVLAQMYLLEVLPTSANYNLLKTATITIVNGQKDYALPTDFRKVISLCYSNKPAMQVKPEEFYSKVKQASADKDPMFTILDSQIRLFPTPTAGMTAEVMFMAQPVDLTSESSVISLLPEHKRLLTLASIQFLLLATGNTTYAQTTSALASLIIQSKSTWFFNSNITEKPLSQPNPVPATK